MHLRLKHFRYIFKHRFSFLSFTDFNESSLRHFALRNWIYKSWRQNSIVRVIENVAVQMVSNPACEIILCSNKEHKTIEYVLSYLKDTNTLSNIQFSKPPFKPSLKDQC